MDSILMDGYREKQLLNNREQLDLRRWETPLSMVACVAEHVAKRIHQSKELFLAQGGTLFFRGDCHSHTEHSDGIGTVAETAQMAQAAGLDFQFVTDHWGLTQAPECREHGLWYGQEPGTQFHHMLVLGLEQAFTPQMDFLADIASAKQLGATVCIPHPAGWWPTKVYTDEQKQILEELPDPFLMEIVNGAKNIISAIDYTDELALVLWDRLLSMGKKVYAMGNTDAHAPHGIGTIWNGIFTAELTREAVLTSLEAGESFVSEAPLIELRNRQGRLKVLIADSLGLRELKIIVDGQISQVWNWQGNPAPLQATTLEIELPGNMQRYLRAEVTAYDGKRAFSNPVFAD